MLPRQKRLTTALFQKVMAEGRPLHSTFFLARIMKVDAKASSEVKRFSVSVPKKIAKTAVLRNTIRRRTYSALRPILPDLMNGIQAVLIAKPPLLAASLDDISKNLSEFFGKIGLLK